MTYAFDPDLAPWVSMLPNVPFSDVHAARASMDEMLAAVPVYERLVPVDVRDTSTPDVPVRIYRPAGEGPLPGLLSIHGGGFAVGTLETEHNQALRIAA